MLQLLAEASGASADHHQEGQMDSPQFTIANGSGQCLLCLQPLVLHACLGYIITP